MVECQIEVIFDTTIFFLSAKIFIRDFYSRCLNRLSLQTNLTSFSSVQKLIKTLHVIIDTTHLPCGVIVVRAYWRLFLTLLVNSCMLEEMPPVPPVYFLILTHRISQCLWQRFCDFNEIFYFSYSTIHNWTIFTINVGLFIR